MLDKNFKNPHSWQAGNCYFPSNISDTDVCFGDSWRWICTIPACFNSLNGLEHWNRFNDSVLCQTKIVLWAGSLILKCIVKPRSVVPCCWWASNSRSQKRKSPASQETSDQGRGTFHLFLLFFCWKCINRVCCSVFLPAHFMFQIIQGFLLSRWNRSLLFLCGCVSDCITTYTIRSRMMVNDELGTI